MLDDALDYEDAQSTTGGSGLGGSAGVPKVITPGVLGKQLPAVNLAAGTKIKMIPPNQFVQISKPLSAQGKLINYTLNKPGVGTASTATIGSIVKTLPSSSVSGQQIFTLKTPTGQTQQFATAGSSTGAVNSSTGAGQQKYTVFKNANGMTMLHLTKSVPTTAANSPSGSMDLSNIIDMPIVFADNEGNIPEADKDIKPGGLNGISLLFLILIVNVLQPPFVALIRAL